ncbi:hypothetical protein ABZ371_27840 [Streptomyces sp. NPDC005899]|uniref:hypothetical protein n=1 Tax=Streptomyces sp. NPDC005899 TaxID=3155716 RepID=UPI0033FD57D0
MSQTYTREAQLNRLWGAACAFTGIFLLLWGLSWVNAEVLHEDLPNHCADLRTARFPVEASCVHQDGTVEGANALLFTGAFFGAMTAGTLCLGAAFLTEVRRRK